jgi:hypothetical protein
MDDPRRAMARVLTGSPIGRQAAQQAAASTTTRPTGATGGGGQQPIPVTQDRIMDELGAELNDLWNLSNPHVPNIPNAGRRLPLGNPGTRKVEQGCWIICDTRSGALRSARFTLPSTRDECDPGAPPLQAHERVAAFFHTHPNTGEEGYDRGPSPADRGYATSTGYPGLIRTQIGGYTWFGPAVS